jgi:hypothetical protein
MAVASGSAMRRMKAEHRPASDANAIVRKGGEDQGAGRQAGTVDDDALPGFAHRIEHLQKWPDLPARARDDAQVC